MQFDLRVNLKLFFISLLFSSCFVQVEVYSDEASGSSLNAYHIFLGLFFLFFALTRKGWLRGWRLPWYFFSVAGLVTIVSFFLGNFSLRASLLPIIVLAYFCGVIAGREVLKKQALDRVFGFLFWALILFLAFRAILFSGRFFELYSRSGMGGDFFYLSSGGGNIEATFLGMISVFYLGWRRYWVIWLIALATALLMMSRAGFISCFLSLGFYFFNQRKRYASVLMVLVAAMVTVSGSLFWIEQGGISGGIVERFNFSEELYLADDDQGRIALWNSAIRVIEQNPFGYGVGMGFSRMKEIVGIEFRENNVHNIALQVALDCGLIGCLLFLAILVTLVWRCFFGRSRERLLYFCVMYFALGMIEFTGFDVFFWLIVGMLVGGKFSFDASSRSSSREETSPTDAKATEPLPV